MRIGLMHGDGGNQTIEEQVQQIVDEEKDGFDERLVGPDLRRRLDDSDRARGSAHERRSSWARASSRRTRGIRS